MSSTSMGAIAILVAVVVGFASAALAAFVIGGFLWAAMHVLPDFGLYLYLVVLMIGPPVFGVLAGVLTYRGVKAAVLARADKAEKDA